MKLSSSGSELLTLRRSGGSGTPAEAAAAAAAAASPMMNWCSPLSDQIPQLLNFKRNFLFGLRENSAAIETAPILHLHRGWQVHLLNEYQYDMAYAGGTRNLVQCSH